MAISFVEDNSPDEDLISSAWNYLDPTIEPPVPKATPVPHKQKSPHKHPTLASLMAELTPTPEGARGPKATYPSQMVVGRMLGRLISVKQADEPSSQYSSAMAMAIAHPAKTKIHISTQHQRRGTPLPRGREIHYKHEPPDSPRSPRQPAASLPQNNIATTREHHTKTQIHISNQHQRIGTPLPRGREIHYKHEPPDTKHHQRQKNTTRKNTERQLHIYYSIR